jgi:hypothetical protein
VILGLIALTRGRTKRATNCGQAGAGLICGMLALALAIVFPLRVGTFVARNSNVSTNSDRCITQTANHSEVSTCIATSANKIR